MKTARPRRLALVVAAVGLSLSATGCAYFNPVQTEDFYQAADGTNANPDGVGVRNAVLVVDENGDGQVFMTVANATAKDATATLKGTAEDTTVFTGEVPVTAGGTVEVGPEGTQQIPVQHAIVKPGDIMQLTVSSEGEKPTTISMPVMDDSLKYYPGVSDGGQG